MRGQISSLTRKMRQIDIFRKVIRHMLNSHTGINSQRRVPQIISPTASSPLEHSLCIVLSISYCHFGTLSLARCCDRVPVMFDESQARSYGVIFNI
jgi:hypothetical protein